MASSNSKLGSLITQLHNRTNEAKEAFDQALIELEQEKATNEKHYQEQLQLLKQERQKWNEEKATMEKLIASASPIINLNVGGEKISTLRTTLTVVEGSLLATMFLGNWEDKLMKDANGCIFLDYDPTLFKYLLNQLRLWSDPSTKRILRLPVGSEQSFVEFLRLLKIDDKFISNETSGTTNNNTVKIMQTEQRVEYFRTTSNVNVQLTDNGRRCELIGPDSWPCVFGAQNYSTGIHRIRLKLEKGTTNLLMGICSQNKPPTGVPFYDKPTTHGWFMHGYVMTNGQGSHPGWPQVNENDILQLTLDCNGRSLSILNERNRAEHSMQVDINQAPFPWCLLVILGAKNHQVSLV